MKNEPSLSYKTFYDHVFGDYRYFYHNGLSEDIFTSLNESDWIEAEKMILQALKKVFTDERAIRAAGYLKMREAIPVLEKRLAFGGVFLRKEARSSIVWALLKIKQDKQQLDRIINVVNGSARHDDLKRADAIELISDFGEEPSVVKALLHAFLSKDYSVSLYADHALRKIFKDNQEISDLFKLHGFAPPFYIRDSVVKHIELQMQN